MYRREQDPLTEHIRTVLYEHQEPYQLGSWEGFSRYKLQKQKKNRHAYLLRAAAVLLVSAAGLFTWLQTEQDVPTHLAQELPPVPAEQPALPLGELPPVDVAIPSVFDEHERPSLRENWNANGTAMLNNAGDTEPGRAAYDESAYISYRPVAAQRISETDRFHALAKAHLPLLSPDSETMETPRRTPNTYRTNSNSELLANSYSSSYPADDDIARYVPVQSRELFSFGLAYAPLMNIHESQASLGMSGGIYTGWNITEKISVTSGLMLAQNQLKYGMEHGTLMQDFSETERTLSAPAGDLSHIRADLLTLEIPLGVRYSITDQFSFSAGISSVTFLKERYDYEFEFEQSVQVFTTESDRIDARTEIVRYSETHQQSERSFNSTDWAAFYTFSLGYRFDVADRHTLSLEPFLKIPNRNLASRDIKYTTGGMQLTLSF